MEENLTIEQKATEIANEVAQETDYKDTAAYEAAIKMAKWKDEQYKILLDAKDQSLIQTEMDFNSMPISKLGGWHKEKPTEDCTVLLYTETQFHKNAPYVIAEWDNHAQCFYDEADDEPISEWIKWKRL